MSTAVVTAEVPVTFEAGATVPCRPGETVLHAGLRAGLDLPYECASGGCGSCRAVLVEGTVTSNWPDAAGLTERDRRRGNRVLMCQSLPDGPCTVRATPITVVDRGAEPPPSRLAGRIEHRELLTADTARFLVRVEGELPYLPGQFVLLDLVDGTRRAYSMTRPFDPGDPDAVELLIRAKPGGAASAVLFGPDAPGSALTVEGPYGRAYGRPASPAPVVCLAGGTGLAPILAIADDLVGRGRGVELYVGARRAADLVLVDRLLALRDRGAHVVGVVEQPGEHPALGPLRAGLALDHLADDRPDLGAHDVYLAGPAPMIDASLRRLVRNGTARADRVFFDRFLA